MDTKKGYFEINDSMIFIGDALTVLQKISSNSIQCIITSPPYWGMRDYKINGQIGLEKDFSHYLSDLVKVFEEARRVLKANGTLWLNIGDSYTSGNRKYRANDKKNPARKMGDRPDTPAGLKRKDLIGIPWHLAFALQSSGWYLRSDIIWHKPNGMPESVKDRPYRNHEYLFLFSKSEKYYFDFEALNNTNGKKKRSVWEIPIKPNTSTHNAVFPEDLIVPCIQASTKENEFILDPFYGSGTVGKVCEKLNRKHIGVELNPEYANIALAHFKNKVSIMTMKR